MKTDPVLPFEDYVTRVFLPTQLVYLKPRTKTHYRLALEGHLYPAFGPMPMDTIRTAHIRTWFEEYSRAAPINANNVIGVMSRILDHGIENKVLSYNPAKGIKRNPKRKGMRILSDEERIRLLAYLDQLPAEMQVRADIIRMILLTGCRSGEIVNLKIKDVAKNKLTLTDSKVGPRDVWIGKEVQDLLERQRQRQAGMKIKSAYVFPNHRNPRRPYNHFDRFWDEHRTQMGLGDVVLHDLRRTFATNADRHGIPLPVITTQMGHSDCKMTMEYIHHRPADLEIAAEAMGSILGAQLGLTPKHRGGTRKS
jgi:integrase